MKPIKISQAEWLPLRNQLHNDYPKQVMAIRSVMKRVLGFTVRLHTEYKGGYDRDTAIHLDFFNEPKRTMFLLKYSDWLTGAKEEE